MNTGGYQSDISGGGGGSNGAVFITDIVPQNGNDNVGGKVYSSNGLVLDQCVSNTDSITVHVLAITGNSHFEPIITVEGISVPLSQDEDQSVWKGSIDLDLSGKSSVTAIHEDGPTHTCAVLTDAGPEITIARFNGSYPNGQTELKAGDTMDLFVVSDSPMNHIEIIDFGAGVSQVFDFAQTLEITINVAIANRGNFAQALGIKLRARNANGSFGVEFETANAGPVNGVNTVVLNNQHPQVTFGAITYPVGQQALKNAETAIIEHSISGFDSVTYSSPNGQLSIASPASFGASKSVNRINGDYNISQENFTVSATRAANGALTVAQTVVFIAHSAPQISIANPSARLRSGGNNGTSAQDHLLTITSNQKLISVPIISAPQGTLQDDASTNPNGLLFNQTITIHDNDPKGVFDYELIYATNLAGIVLDTFTGSSAYTIGGFVSRTITVPRFEREFAIGTEVSQTAKLITRDKDQSLMSYANDFNDTILGFTITGPTGQLNQVGNLFYWNDSQAVNNNTTGLATITIEELV